MAAVYILSGVGLVSFVFIFSCIMDYIYSSCDQDRVVHSKPKKVAVVKHEDYDDLLINE